MKRFILGLGIVAVVVVALGGATYFVVDNAIKQANQPVRGGPNTPAPFSYDQLEKMMDAKDAPADSEVPKLIACFDRNDEDLRVIASEALARIGAGGRAVAGEAEGQERQGSLLLRADSRTHGADGCPRGRRSAGALAGQRCGCPLQVSLCPGPARPADRPDHRGPSHGARRFGPRRFRDRCRIAGKDWRPGAAEDVRSRRRRQGPGTRPGRGSSGKDRLSA